MSAVVEKWYEKAAAGLGVEYTDNLKNFFHAWQQSEGGEAAHNPFNTTLKEPGSTDYNSVGVQNYTSRKQGVQAFVTFMNYSNYKSLLAAIKEDANPYYLAVELGLSPWGTSGWLVCKVLHDNGVK